MQEIFDSADSCEKCIAELKKSSSRLSPVILAWIRSLIRSRISRPSSRSFDSTRTRFLRTRSRRNSMAAIQSIVHQNIAFPTSNFSRWLLLGFAAQLDCLESGNKFSSRVWSLTPSLIARGITSLRLNLEKLWLNSTQASRPTPHVTVGGTRYTNDISASLDGGLIALHSKFQDLQSLSGTQMLSGTVSHSVVGDTVVWALNVGNEAVRAPDHSTPDPHTNHDPTALEPLRPLTIMLDVLAKSA